MATLSSGDTLSLNDLAGANGVTQGANVSLGSIKGSPQANDDIALSKFAVDTIGSMSGFTYAVEDTTETYTISSAGGGTHFASKNGSYSGNVTWTIPVGSKISLNTNSGLSATFDVSSMKNAATQTILQGAEQHTIRGVFSDGFNDHIGSGAGYGANKDKTGKFEAANNGTIFLDEIGDMSLSAQAKVLRALESNSIQKVGAQKDIKINVRVVAATNKNLKDEITKGNFREDLYHRLAVILIKVPSLNSRADDIPLLVEYFSDKISKSQGINNKPFTKDAVSLLKSYDWSGNIRGLRNVVERLIILGDETEITENNIKEYSNK